MVSLTPEKKMKSKKTKKILGGVAIAAVSLGCLGLAGIANAADTTTGTTSSSSTGSAPASGAYQLGPMTGAMTGTTTITANISAAQVESGEKLSDHSLEYIQIGSYMTHGSSGSFTVSASTQKVEDALYNFLTAPTGGLKQAFPDSDYATSKGEAFNWLLTGNSGTFLGHDASGQGNYGVSDNTDYAVRLLANYLYDNVSSLGALTDAKLTSVTTTNGTQAGSFNVNNPGVYLIIDNVSSNASLPIILSTMPTKGYTIPQGMTNWVTDQIALKDQDPQAMPVKQFVTGTSVDKSGDLTGGTLSDSVTSSVGSQNTVTYQISNVFPNTNGYKSYTYKFIDYPGLGMTLNIAGGANMYVAGIPLATLVSNGDATVTTVSDSGTPQKYGTATGDSTLSAMGNLVGAANSASSLTVSLDEAGMQYIAQNGYQTSNVSGKGINFSKLFTTALPSSKSAYQSSVSNTVNGTTNNMQGAGNGASSYTGQTQKAASGENTNTTTNTTTKQTYPEYPQAQGELFGLTYQAYLNTNVQTKVSNSAPVTEASNTAETVNNGVQSGPTNSVPLKTSGTYNGGKNPENGQTSGTKQINPGDTTGSINGVPSVNTVGAGINWMKIWGSGSVASGAEFQVQNSKGEYLYAAGDGSTTGTTTDTTTNKPTGWAWTTDKSQAQTFSASSLYGSASSSSTTGTTGTTGTGTTGTGSTGTGSMGSSSSSAVNPAADGGLFEITGLADGTYTVTETHAANGADQNVLPSFQVTVTEGSPEKILTTSASDNLVDNTPNGNPFNSTDYRTVENVKSVTGLPLTGGAGILTGVIAAVLLFGTAGIVLVVYKRRKAQREE